MSVNKARIEKVIQQIKGLKNALVELERERDDLLAKNGILENKIKQQRKEETSELSIQKEEVKLELERHIEEIDTCLDLLKTI